MGLIFLLQLQEGQTPKKKFRRNTKEKQERKPKPSLDGIENRWNVLHAKKQSHTGGISITKGVILLWSCSSSIQSITVVGYSYWLLFEWYSINLVCTVLKSQLLRQVTS